MSPDVEKIISGYLREAPEVQALNARIVGKTPSATAEPWVRVTQLDDRSVGGHRSEHLHEFYVQFDCYAGADGGQPEASLLARTVRGLLVGAPSADLDVTVTGVDIRSHARIPDVGVDEPARERFVITALAWIHA